MKKKSKYIIVIVILICILFAAAKILNQLDKETPFTTNNNPSNTSTDTGEMINFTTEYLSLMYKKEWVINQFTTPTDCQMLGNNKVDCIFIIDPTSKFQLVIKRVHSIEDPGGGTITTSNLKESEVLIMDNYNLIRQAMLNYMNPTIGIPVINLYFVDDSTPNLGDFYSIWKIHDNYRVSLSYQINSEETPILSENELEELDTIIRSIDLKD